MLQSLKLFIISIVGTCILLFISALLYRYHSDSIYDEQLPPFLSHILNPMTTSGDVTSKYNEYHLNANNSDKVIITEMKGYGFELLSQESTKSELVFYRVWQFEFCMNHVTVHYLFHEGQVTKVSIDKRKDCM